MTYVLSKEMNGWMFLVSPDFFDCDGVTGLNCVDLDLGSRTHRPGTTST